MDIRIKQPETDEEFKDYYHLRWKLLRAPWNQPQGSETDDIEDQCFHIMALTMNEDEKDKVIGVARLQYNSETEAQIRYMAIAREYERKGIGRKIMNTMEEHAGSSMCKNIVLDARQPAVDFYKKLGFKVVKKSYLLFGEIQHFRMKKEL